MYIAGVDEAGRGPVLGPMVMAIASIKKEDEFKLRAIDVKDSKLLTPHRRYELFNVIKDLCETNVVIVSPQEIDEALTTPTDNLNWLEARTAAKLIDKISAKKVILDCPSTNLEGYKNYIKKHLKNKKIEIVVEHKADLNHLIVSAASIIAKVVRDEEIEKIRVKTGKEIGSGYSSDPTTQKFIDENWSKKEYSKFIRKSWDTWQRRHHQNAQKKLGEF